MKKEDLSKIKEIYKLISANKKIVDQITVFYILQFVYINF